MLTASRQTIGRHAHGSLGLSGSTVSKGAVLSPYFQTNDLRKEAPGRDKIYFSPMAYRVIFGNISYDGPSAGVFMHFVDTTTNQDVFPIQIDLTAAQMVDAATTRASIISATIAWAVTQGITITSSDIVFPFDSALVPAPSSYQTIVTQAGTAAPATAGGLAPTSTYPAGTTFAWARTGAGVYTLTASAAVFSTSKTGVFVAPLTNLNASVRAVVTSTTVITVTTAVQSVAVLGLLGLTASPTDALLSGTMIYVQTYS